MARCPGRCGCCGGEGWVWGKQLLTVSMEVFQDFNFCHSCSNGYRMHRGPLQGESAFLGEFTLCFILWLNFFLSNDSI